MVCHGSMCSGAVSISAHWQCSLAPSLTAKRGLLNSTTKSRLGSSLGALNSTSPPKAGDAGHLPVLSRPSPRPRGRERSHQHEATQRAPPSTVGSSAVLQPPPVSAQAVGRGSSMGRDDDRYKPERPARALRPSRLPAGDPAARGGPDAGRARARYSAATSSTTRRCARSSACSSATARWTGWT